MVAAVVVVAAAVNAHHKWAEHPFHAVVVVEGVVALNFA